MDCFCDYEPAELYRRREVKESRKPFSCEECGRKVEPGEPYEYVFGSWNGVTGTFKTCANCLDLRKWVMNNVPCFCWAHGNMLDDAQETCDMAIERAPLETAGLRFGFLRRRHTIQLAARSSRP